MIFVGCKLRSVMVKPQRQTDKLQKTPKEEQDLSLPPPIQLLEKRMAASTPVKKDDEARSATNKVSPVSRPRIRITVLLMRM